jgi:hypothetical protein
VVEIDFEVVTEHFCNRARVRRYKKWRSSHTSNLDLDKQTEKSHYAGDGCAQTLELSIDELGGMHCYQHFRILHGPPQPNAISLLITTVFVAPLSEKHL